MKNSFIIGVVWISVIALVVSFGLTIFFLDGMFFEKEEAILENNLEKQTRVSYITDESSIRTKELAQANITNYPERKTDIKNSFDEIESGESLESISKIQSFVKPINGEKIKSIATEELVYSKTLNEWTTHKGIDYKAMLGQEVFSVAEGEIVAIDFNYMYGNYIIISHNDGYESLYANVTVLDALSVGDILEKGQIIGYLAESYGFESADETHLHFELKKDEKYIEIIT